MARHVERAIEPERNEARNTEHTEHRGEADQREHDLSQPATPENVDHASGSPRASDGDGVRGGNGTNGHNHFAPSPHARAGARVLLTALGKNNGEGAKALMNGLARIAMGTEPNPWPILALWKHLRDTVDGLPKPAPEMKDPRRLARIILTNRPAPSPPADAAEPADPPRGWHEENGQRFVSVSPPPEE